MAMTKPNSSQIIYKDGSVESAIDKLGDVSSKSILQYATLAEATEAAKALPDGQDIEVLQDEMRDGASSRYSVQSGALVFKKNLDRLRDDLINPTGNEPVGGLDSYAKVRSYSGRATRMKVKNLSGMCWWVRDPSVSDDNSVTKLLDGLGRGWRREKIKAIDLRWVDGCDPTGQTDTTSVFQKAFDVAAELEYSSFGPVRAAQSVYVPNGVHYVGGKVEIDARIGLVADSTNTIITGSSPLGVSSASAGFLFKVPAANGIAPHVKNLTFFGFQNGTAIESQASGMIVEGCFISSSNEGIRLSTGGHGGPASDVTISHCIFDQNVTDVALRNAANTVISSCHSFMAYNFVKFTPVGSGVSDTLIVGCMANYTITAALHVDAAGGVRNTQVKASSFMLNAQHSTFQGFLYTSPLANSVEMFFSGCTFRNWREFAVRVHNDGVYEFNDCTFDANRTSPEYVQSSDSKCVMANGTTNPVLFNACTFRNIPEDLFTGYNNAKLRVIGGRSYFSPKIKGGDSSFELSTEGFTSAGGNTLYGPVRDLGRKMQIEGQLHFGENLDEPNKRGVLYSSPTETGIINYDETPTAFWSNGQKFITIETNGVFSSTIDNGADLGMSSRRWRDIYLGNSPIVTSDAREKSEPLAIDDGALDAWGDVQFICYQWLSAIALKGEEARIHFGVIAQQVRDAFLARGLDGTQYGLLCYDEWGDIYEPVLGKRINSDGFEETYETGGRKLVMAAGNRWGIRADQCLFLEAAYQRRRAERIEARLTAIEAKLID